MEKGMKMVGKTESVSRVCFLKNRSYRTYKTYSSKARKKAETAITSEACRDRDSSR